MRRVPIAGADHWLCRLGFHRPGEVHDGPLAVNGRALDAETCVRCGVTATLSPIYAGTAVAWATAFTVPNGTATTPTAVSYTYKAGSAASVTWTYPGGGGQITLVSTGNVTATLDTTALAGLWVIKAIGTGACVACNVATFQVNTPPI